MPLYGVREIEPLLEHAPVMVSLHTDECLLPNVEVLQVMYEIADRSMLDLLPRALHPTIPPTVTFVFWKATEGPLGAFTLAQVRIGSRAGVRPRGFLLLSYCESEPAAEALRSRWGYNCRPAAVRLKRSYDRISGSVVVADEQLLQATLIDPQAISGGDVQYVANMNLARVQREGGGAPRLVQVDPEFTFRKAERGRPKLERFQPNDAIADGLSAVYPISASYAICDITMPRIRYITDPDRPAMQGTETVEGASH